MANLTVLNTNTSLLAKASNKIRNFVNAITDDSSFVETDAFMSGASFLDGAEALGEGVLTGYATIDGFPVCIAAQNSEVLKGSLGKAHADKILKVMDRAIRTDSAFISIIDSAGARIGEGVSVLEGYAQIIAGATNLKGVVPHISIIKGNAIGLTGAFAMTADLVIMGEESVTSFAAPLAVAAKAGVNPKAQDLLGAKTHSTKNLQASLTYKTEADLKATVTELLTLINLRNLELTDDANRTSDALNKTISAKGLTDAICDDKKYTELYAGASADVLTALTRINGNSVGLIVTNKSGTNNILNRAALKKIKKFISTVDSLGLPLINLVDTAGLEVSLEREEAGLAMKVAKLLSLVSNFEANKIAVITGSAVGVGYVALASKAMGYDYVLAFPDAVIAPVSAEIAVTVSYVDEIKSAKDPVDARSKLEKKYSAEEGSPFVSAKGGFVDNIIEPALVRPYLASALNMIVG